MVTITRRFEVDVAHRLLNHESKCRNVHGHRYAFEVEIAGTRLDECGRLMDFSAVAALVGGWLDEKLDHGYVAQAGDPLVAVLEGLGSKVCVLQTPSSIEHLVRYVHESVDGLLPAGLQVVRVRGYETPNCWAESAL